MFGSNFYFHNLLSRYVGVFGTLFNDIQVQRTDKDGAVTQSLVVPITFGPRSPDIAREEGDPTFKRPASLVVPRMSYNISSFNYDPVRKRNTLNIRTSEDRQLVNKIGRKSSFEAVPYEIVFTLSILVQNQLDGLQIVEQIVPFFTPDFTPRIKLVDELDLEMDCPITISALNLRDSYEGQIENTRRTIEWQLDFVMKVYFIGPVNTPKVIKIAHVGMFTSESNLANNTPDETITVQPGLTVDGQPTSDPYQTIPYQQINGDDNYGYIVDVQLGDVTFDGQNALGILDFNNPLNNVYLNIIQSNYSEN